MQESVALFHRYFALLQSAANRKTSLAGLDGNVLTQAEFEEVVDRFRGDVVLRPKDAYQHSTLALLPKKPYPVFGRKVLLPILDDPAAAPELLPIQDTAEQDELDNALVPAEVHGSSFSFLYYSWRISDLSVMSLPIIRVSDERLHDLHGYHYMWPLRHIHAVLGEKTEFFFFLATDKR